jgi:hypothetical protein
MTSVTFARGRWSEVSLGNMDLGELTPLVERLWDEPDEVLRPSDAGTRRGRHRRSSS